MTVLDYLERDVREFPDRTAVRDESESLTFRELRDRALELSRMPEYAGRKGPVAIDAERTAETLVKFLAAAYAGRAYVPIDPEMPEAKRAKILGELAEEQPEGSLYIVYTSGSTGKPKGVVKSHRAVKSFIEAYVTAFGFDENEVIGNQTPFFFDASAKDIYLMLKTGATLDIIPKRLFMDTIELVKYLDAHGVTFISWVPSALVVVSKMNTFAYAVPKTLKKVFFVGEVMPVRHLRRWMDALPGVRFVNLYGSSEIAGIACYYEVKELPPEMTALPMGRALSNCRIELVDGEIYLVSEALAEGYYREAERTAAAFAMRDFGDGKPVRSFKSGDLAHYDANGDLVFESRGDFQIKHLGHRIELGEIESVAETLPIVNRAGCVYDQARSKIVLFCESTAEPRGVLAGLSGRLSTYMMPARVECVAALPLNANGKVDRMKLMEGLK